MPFGSKGAGKDVPMKHNIVIGGGLAIVCILIIVLGVMNLKTKDEEIPLPPDETKPILLSIDSLDCSKVAPFQGRRLFRNTAWGMSVQQVVCNDTIADWESTVISPSDYPLLFKSAILGYDYNGKYFFGDDSLLVRITYHFSLCDCFSEVLDLLNYKYGKSASLPVYEDDDLERLRWETEDSYITVTTWGLNVGNYAAALKTLVKAGKIPKRELRESILSFTVEYCEIANRKAMDRQEYLEWQKREDEKLLKQKEEVQKLFNEVKSF